jgi:hypothetical protein
MNPSEVKVLCPKCSRLVPMRGYNPEKHLCSVCLLPEAPPEVYSELDKIVREELSRSLLKPKRRRK